MRKGTCTLLLAVIATWATFLLIACTEGGGQTSGSGSRYSTHSTVRYDQVYRDDFETSYDQESTRGRGVAGERARNSSTQTLNQWLGPPTQHAYQETLQLREAVRSATLAPEEELWVITRFKGDDRAQDDRHGGRDLGCGALLTRIPDVEEEVPVPLESTTVDADIAGYVASVNVRQRYHNPFGVKIEAVYAFPLPQNAAVNGFIMTIGDRRIRGVIREREQAEKIYNEAKSQGHVASMMSQERPNIFTQRVANIEPGRSIDIDITYHHTVAYDDGWHEWVFPMTIGPRYNPPRSRNGVGAAPRSAASTGQPADIHYLAPHETSRHRVGLSLNIDAGVEIEEIECSTHDVEIRRASNHGAVVKLSPYDDLPDRDFVLRYRVAGERLKSALLTHREGKDGYFSLVLYPPVALEYLERGPTEVIFVLDCSGSMSGKPIEQAKAAIDRGLGMLREGDTFQIIRFSENASKMGAQPVPVTRESIRRARRYVASLSGSGGTQMIEGIKSALRYQHDRSRQRYVVFLTDGFIGNEADILEATHDHLGDARVFSFGVGSSPNRYLLDRMAKIGRGAVAYLGPGDNGEDVMQRFFERASCPAMTDIDIDSPGSGITDVYPRRIPDLFVGRPVVVTGRFRNTGDPLRITGRIGGRKTVIETPFQLNDADAEHPAIATIWARSRIADLVDESTWRGAGAVTRAIRNTALDYGLVSAFTSFVAVDSLSKTSGDFGVTVDVPVNVPEGVQYETTVGRR